MKYTYAILMIVCLCLGHALSPAIADEDPAGRMASSFRAPPDSARPWVYWFWSEGNITREGMTADLEAMQRVGIGGVLIMEVAQDIPKGPVRFGSAPWRELFKHAIAEATRLGLQVSMNNDAGWSGSGGPWITPEQSMQKLVWTELNIEGPRKFNASLPRPNTVENYYREVAVLAFPTPAADAKPSKQISRQNIRDISDRLDAKGHLNWDVPAGKWTVLRLGHTSTGSNNLPAPLGGQGLECDKLNRRAMDAHFAGLMAKLIADTGPAAGKTLTWTHIDSWEVHSQNWTPLLREEFQRRRGYAPLLFLPVMAGWTVDSPEISKRFTRDMSCTVAELLNENYAGRLSELAKRHGMKLSIEAYGDGPFEPLSYAGRADSPMGEFWTQDWCGFETLKPMASAAHTYGRKIVPAEAFTSVPKTGKWQNHPFTLKSLGDIAFCDGINHIVFHRYAHQPWLDRKPGMTMGPWGVHYERTQTWWEQSRPWHEYLARCQYLLRRGLFVADVCYLQPEGILLHHIPRNRPATHGFDDCPAEVVLERMKVDNGRLILPDGMSYRLLVLPPSETMTPELLTKVKQLVEAGATVVGKRPLESPSLSDYPRCDKQVQELAAQLWGDCDGKKVTEHGFGKGKIICGKTPQAVLAEMGVSADFRTTASGGIRHIHRRTDGTDIYFVANSGPQEVETVCTFRAKGKQPEFWYPDSGRIEQVAVYDEAADGTRIPIHLDKSGSVFVVFPADTSPTPNRVVSLTRDGKRVTSAQGDMPKIVVSKATYGPPGDTARTRDVKKQVQQLVDQGNCAFLVAEMAKDGDPAVGVVKTLAVEYTIDGRPQTAAATDPWMIHLLKSDMQDAELNRGMDGRLWLMVRKPGQYELTTAAGKAARVQIPPLPQPFEPTGDWQLSIEPDPGKPQRIMLDKLDSWTNQADAGVKYFSGTATYTKKFHLPAGMTGKSRRIRLDLGRVEVIAAVKLNGKDLGILWKSPFSIDVTDTLQDGENTLEVRVTNLWVNRLIGDELLPADCQWGPPNKWGGQPIAKWPQWLLDGKPSPTGRHAFTTWRHWSKDSPLLESGLLGPVRFVATECIEMTEGR